MVPHCSSNPLELSPSDPRNRAYVQAYAAYNIASSDDPLNCYGVEVEEYRRHVDTLVHGGGGREGGYAYEEEEDMESDDELRLVLPEDYGGDGRSREDLGVDLCREEEDDECDEEERHVDHAAEEVAIDERWGGVVVDEDHEGQRHGEDAEREEGEDDDLNRQLEDDEQEEYSSDEDEEDAAGSMDEEMTIHLKHPDEHAEILEEIAELEQAVPQLASDYKITDRLGTGTFSSVYKAIDLGYHTKWDNTAWHGFHPPSSSARYQSAHHPVSSKVFVAIKRIYVTSSPERIGNEIAIMEDCRGCRHVSQLVTAFRHEDQVVAVMPFQRNDDFRVRLHAIT
jgi:hypothetical protein